MYNPTKFKSTDIDSALRLMEQNPFATLISVIDENPFISHLPLTAKKVGNDIELMGHLARANPHSKYLAENTLTVIFHGPHTYITPQWYAANDVPTWNYSAIHVSGHPSLIEDQDGLIECLKELTNHTERYWPSGWEFYIPDDLTGEQLSKHIIGFKMKIENINFKEKLSQNRSSADRAGIIKGLESRSDDASRAVLQEMLKIYSSNEERK